MVDSSQGSPRPRKEHPSDVAAIDEELLATEGDLDPRRAYEMLEIRTPLEEFEAYVRARIETLGRLGDTEKSHLTAEALELGRKALARVTGAPLPDSKGARS
jgi:hypothetical protein